METNIESHLIEKRVFKPAKDFSKKARIKSLAQYRKMYRESMRRPDAFWAREAKELVWRKPWKKVLEWKAPSRNGSVAGNSIFRKIASIVILTVRDETRLPSFGKANRARNAPSLISNYIAKSVISPTC